MTSAEFNTVPISQIRSALRKMLLSDGDSCQWLAGLEFAWDKNTLVISFVHSLFAEWFFNNKLERCDNALQRILGDSRQHEFNWKNAWLPKMRLQNFQKELDGNTLENFLDNGDNSLALAAAKLAASKENNLEKPFILTFCGVAGSGKTHLLEGIYHALSQNFPDREPGFNRALQFFTASPLAKDFWLGQFWRCHAALLLDDFDELKNEPQLQAKLSAAIKEATLLAKKNPEITARMLFAWNGPISDIEKLEANLRLQLEQGLIFQLQPPDLTIRLHYLEKKAKKMDLSLGREQALLLARQTRQLPIMQGILQKIKLFALLHKKIPDNAELEKLLENQREKVNLDWKQILQKVCLRLKIDPQQALDRSRKADAALARQLAMYLCRRKLGFSYPELGRLFGGKDHSTVMHSIKKIQFLKDTDKEMQSLVTELEKMLE